MAKIKHIALTTYDLDKVASFYKEVFGMEEMGRSGSTHVYLSDGELNLTIRECKKSDADGNKLDLPHHASSPRWRKLPEFSSVPS